MWGLFISALIGALAAAMASLAGRAFVALGFGFVTYKGIDLGVAALKNLAISHLNGMPADAVGLMGYLWFDKALSVIFSAFVVALSLKLVAGGLKKVVAK